MARTHDHFADGIISMIAEGRRAPSENKQRAVRGRRTSLVSRVGRWAKSLA